MKTIYLQRQGCSRTLNTNNEINNNLRYHITINQYPPRTGKANENKTTHNYKYANSYLFTVSYSSRNHSLKEKRGQTAFSSSNDEIYDSLKTVKEIIEKNIYIIFGEKVKISDITERYCHGWFNRNGIEKDDKFLAVTVYERSSDTIRLLPENIALVAFKEKGTENDSLINVSDPAVSKYLPMLEEQAKLREKEKLQSCHATDSDEHMKERMAWLIGEAIKEKEPDRELLICESLIR